MSLVADMVQKALSVRECPQCCIFHISSDAAKTVSSGPVHNRSMTGQSWLMSLLVVASAQTVVYYSMRLMQFGCSHSPTAQDIPLVGTGSRMLVVPLSLTLMLLFEVDEMMILPLMIIVLTVLSFYPNADDIALPYACHFLLNFIEASSRVSHSSMPAWNSMYHDAEMAYSSNSYPANSS
ncbi:hypothetical protein QBC33DRAFT_537951 [Phialemonium atrogriseum]|uniref:Uncharacterized protein n=1 Tax=Phialemonium atrogriseum TaxID=1093897 RepID=A0AAJ0FG69_9PEZI|nr:uncharacterized protein QBC33DRAFT_537951 [Phialemonium atrogriseum]KAK1767306.1 hypothetical protein QBC33DRAFT_537951 [Phialemonium atrogriseum]